MTQGCVHHSSIWQGPCSKFLSNEENQVYHLTKWIVALSLMERKVLAGHQPSVPTQTGASTAKGLHVLPQNNMTRLGFGETFANTMAMKVSVDQGRSKKESVKLECE